MRKTSSLTASMKSYLSSLLHNFTQPRSYKKWTKLPKKQVYKFFAVSILLLGLIQGSLFSIFQVPVLFQRLHESMISLQESYPDDLIVDWNGATLQLLPQGKYHVLETDISSLPFLHNSLPESYFFRYQAQELSEREISSLFQGENTLLLVQPQTVFFLTDTNDVSQEPLRDVLGTRPFTLESTDLPPLRAELEKNFQNWMPKVQLFLPLLFALIFLIKETVISIFSASLLWLITRLTKVPETWSENWRLTLALLVTANCIQAVAVYLAPQSAFMIKETAFWILAGFILLSWKLPVLTAKKK